MCIRWHRVRDEKRTSSHGGNAGMRMEVRCPSRLVLSWYKTAASVTLDSEAGTGCPFESNEHHVRRPQPFTYKPHSPLAQECWRWPRIAISISTLRSADPYKASTGDSGRENIVGHDQGARVSDFSFPSI